MTSSGFPAGASSLFLRGFSRVFESWMSSTTTAGSGSVPPGLRFTIHQSNCRRDHQNCGHREQRSQPQISRCLQFFGRLHRNLTQYAIPSKDRRRIQILIFRHQTDLEILLCKLGKWLPSEILLSTADRFRCVGSIDVMLLGDLGQPIWENIVRRSFPIIGGIGGVCQFGQGHLRFERIARQGVGTDVPGDIADPRSDLEGIAAGGNVKIDQFVNDFATLTPELSNNSAIPDGWSGPSSS